MPKKEDTFNLLTGQPSEADDLKLINGIGPAVEKRLNGVGIFTFAQLAVLSSADIAAAVADLSGLSAERITKQGWIGQACKLAEESTGKKAQHVELEKSAGSSMELYQIATFTIKFLLDDHKNVHSTYAQNVETCHEHSWTGWEKTQLLDFLSESAGLNISLDEHDLIPENVSESELPTPLTAKPKLTGKLYVPKMEMIGVGSAGHRRTLVHNEPFDVRLTLDLSKLLIPGYTPLLYKTSIYGKGRGRHGFIIREAQGTIIPHDSVAITVEGNTLSEEGSYQLTATVILGLPTMKLVARSGTTAIIDGGQLEVY